VHPSAVTGVVLIGDEVFGCPAGVIPVTELIRLRGAERKLETAKRMADTMNSAGVSADSQLHVLREVLGLGA
jgi:hypothetical protein